jgi:hypothetical protein
VQKFPFILDEIGGEHRGRTFANIVNEAHSSHGGRTTAKMHVALSEHREEVAEETFEDKINRIMEARKMLPNASYFAFTAMPKNKTLEIFDEPHQDGEIKPLFAEGGGWVVEPELDKLSSIIKTFNDLYGSYPWVLYRTEPSFCTRTPEHKKRPDERVAKSQPWDKLLFSKNHEQEEPMTDRWGVYTKALQTLKSILKMHRQGHVTLSVSFSERQFQ